MRWGVGGVGGEGQLGVRHSATTLLLLPPGEGLGIGLTTTCLLTAMYITFAYSFKQKCNVFLLTVGHFGEINTRQDIRYALSFLFTWSPLTS